MTLQEIKERCIAAFKTAGLDFEYFGIEVAINGRLTRTLGRCMYKGKMPCRLEFSRQFIDYSTKKNIQDVILHECAHAIACIRTGEPQGHNAIFKSICKEIGTSLDTTSSKVESTVSDTKLFKYFVSCEKCRQICGKYHRAGKIIKNISNYSCKCGGSLKVTQNF